MRDLQVGGGSIWEIWEELEGISMESLSKGLGNDQVPFDSLFLFFLFEPEVQS
ncbi:hypothetical protein C943_02728 [Mariniradius saccharolyticus AK6]|uniref:Uncharacterized protein n=1 Tax=Mariniradius saccharolyticus AK6 TaxID=1239962 RepID=M7X0A6_9BACT|nr:hypothetical protein C943_02728 [Mariniradius saccharolyticus AK6]